jgi:predicted nucleotidyltransferase
MGLDGSLLESPNNILAVEYCKAILAQKVSMQPMPIVRKGDYHDTCANLEDPSATAIRQLMVAGKDWMPFILKKRNRRLQTQLYTCWKRVKKPFYTDCAP